MFWDLHNASEDREQSLGAHLLHELESRYAVSPEQRVIIRDVAHSVAVYCADDAARGIPSSYLNILLSRALWGVGETEIAEQVLTDHVEQRAIKETLKALLAVSEVSPMLWRAVVRGAVRKRSDWMSADADTLWVLDLTRVQTTPCDMELARFLTERTLLRALVPVWDVTDGAGALAVRFGSSTDEVNERLSFARDILTRESEQRAWRAIPRVLHLP